MNRLLKIEPATSSVLDADDECVYIGEYTSHGTFRASETNQSIVNLKIEPPVPENRVRYKNCAIRDWGDRLANLLNLAAAANSTTFVPAPCSKPVGHPNYDDRMLRVLQRLALHEPKLDIRPVLITPVERARQHRGERMTIDELVASMAIDPAQLAKPMRPRVMVVDDVFTVGRTFKAMQRVLLQRNEVEHVSGLFLARTIWTDPIRVGDSDAL